ncbi:hypothetical protein [Streptomyces sp. NPDC051098]|uniref:hypothetical protein n=1 Tax=Streptomyces sp. NPDC051098 TaxID=3155411 RepID=UPI003442EAF0
MPLNRRKTATALLAAVAATGSLLASAAPASAAPDWQCKATKKMLSLPNKPDVAVTVDICLAFTGSSGSYRGYEAYVRKVSWDGTGFATGGKRLNDAYVQVRAEHKDRAMKSTTERVDDYINGSEAGWRGAFYGAAKYWGTKRTFTADGALYADIADDGKGYIRYDLAGTRAV